MYNDEYGNKIAEPKKVEYVASSEDEDVAEIFMNMLEDESRDIFNRFDKKWYLLMKI